LAHIAHTTYVTIITDDGINLMETSGIRVAKVICAWLVVIADKLITRTFALSARIVRRARVTIITNAIYRRELTSVNGVADILGTGVSIVA